MKIDWDKIAAIFVYGFFSLSAIIIISGFIYGGIVDKKESDYCRKLFPTPIKEISTFSNDWGGTHGIEKGYIKCCRKLYVNHTKETECKIFKYNKG